MADITTPLRNEPMTDRGGFITPPWYVYFREQGQAIAAAPSAVISPVLASDQAAAITTTPLPTESLAPGLYRVSYYLRITQEATVSSSVALTITWTDEGTAMSHTFDAIVDGIVTDHQSDSLPLLEIDQASPVSYSTSYASAGATDMEYKLVVFLERVAA